jgi:hypothetical protein
VKIKGFDGMPDVCGVDSAILETYELKGYPALVKVSDGWHSVKRLLIRFSTGRYRLLLSLRLVRLAVQLDQLRPDNCPKYLAKCLQSALEQRHFYNQYILKLEGQVEKAQSLLEVFDKVRRRGVRDSGMFTRYDMM